MGMTKEMSYLSVFNDPRKTAQTQKHCCCTFECGKSNIYEHKLCNSKITLVGTQTHDTSSNIYSRKEKMSNFTSDIIHQRHPLTLILPRFGHRSCAGFTSGLVGSTWTWPSSWKESPSVHAVFVVVMSFLIRSKNNENSDAWKRLMWNSMCLLRKLLESLLKWFIYAKFSGNLLTV